MHTQFGGPFAPSSGSRTIGEHGLVRLYVPGHGPLAGEAWYAVRTVGLKLPGGTRTDVQLLDVSDRPETGRAAGILLTPTFVRVRPGPERRGLGDFTSTAVVSKALGAEYV